MKILVFCYEYPPIGGGAGNALSYLARTYVQQNHPTTIVTSHYGSLPESEIRDGVKILRLKVGRESSFRGRVREMLRYFIDSYLRIDQFVKSEKPDICIAFMTIPGGLAPLRIREKYGIPFVTELRGGDVPGFDPTALKMYHALSKGLIHRIWKKSSHIITISESLSNLARKSLPGLDVKIVHNGVDSDFYRPKPRNATTHTPINLLFVGRFADSQKRVSALIPMIKHVPNTFLHLVGDGPDKHMLLDLTKNLNMQDRVRFHGWLKRDDLLKTYQEADIFLNASSYEGFPNAVLQASACGLPLVLSDIEGHREIVSHDGNGYLFTSDEDMIVCVKKLMLNQDIRLRFGESSRQRACREFRWEHAASQHLKFFEEAIAKK